MSPSEALHIHHAMISRIVAGHRAGNPRVIGSVAQGTDDEGSDLDLLIDPEPDMTLLDLGAIRVALIDIPGVDIDVLTPGSVSPDFDFPQALPIA